MSYFGSYQIVRFVIYNGKRNDVRRSAYCKHEDIDRNRNSQSDSRFV